MKDEQRLSPFWFFFEEELIARSEWLINLRWLAFIGSLIAVLFAKFIYKLQISFVNLLPLVIFLGIYNAVFYLYNNSLMKSESKGKEFHRSYRSFANMQISVDLLTLGGMLHFSGGVENPFFFYFAFHMIIASILLKRIDAILQAILAVLICNIVILFEGFRIIEHHALFPHLTDFFNNTKFLMSYCFAISSSLFIIVFMTSSISSKLKEREKEAISLTVKLEEQAEQLIIANKNLMELDEKKSRFLRRVEHELRAPLSAVHSCLRIITDGYVKGIPDKAMEMVSRAEKRTIMLLGMIKELLNLSKLQAVNQPIKEELVNVTALYKDLFEYQKIKADEKKISIVYESPEDEIFVLADPNLLDNVFVNLANNAIKFTPCGGEVFIKLSADDEHVYLTVKDTGIGIPDDNLNKVFEEFHRCPNAIEAGFVGSGLGLAITKQIIDNYKGSITVSSEINKGTQFNMSLPRAKKP